MIGNVHANEQGGRTRADRELILIQFWGSEGEDESNLPTQVVCEEFKVTIRGA